MLGTMLILGHGYPNVLPTLLSAGGCGWALTLLSTSGPGEHQEQTQESWLPLP